MFGTSSFLYFFQLLNNWPRFAVFVWDNTVVPIHQEISIDVSRPRVQGKVPFVSGMANTIEDISKNYGKVHLSACAYWPEGNVTFIWEITKGGQLYRKMTTDNCKTSFQATKQDTYTVSLLIRDPSNTILAAGQREIPVVDKWIVVLGDSFSSGDGNPDIPRNGNKKEQWLSDDCHRSTHSWAYKVYQKYVDNYPDHAIHFTFLSCTGASVDNGVLSTVSRTASQMDTVLEIAKEIDASPNLLLLSVGGNDIGYADIINSLVYGDAQQMFNTVDMRFFYVAHQIDKLADKLRILKPYQIIFPHYFDISRNEKGEIDGDCDEFRPISAENLRLAEHSIFQRLNKLISRKCFEHGWTSVPQVGELFRRRGICSKETLIRTINQSILLQGNSQGAFHPIEEAHSLVAEAVWKRILN